MNPQMLQALLAGQLTKDGSGAGAQNDLGSMMSQVGNNLTPMLLVLAGMGVRELPRLFSSIMDLQQMGKDSQPEPGSLQTPADQGPVPPPGAMGPLPAPPGMSPGGPMPAGGMPAGGPPPGMVQALMQMALQRRMAGGM